MGKWRTPASFASVPRCRGLSSSKGSTTGNRLNGVTPYWRVAWGQDGAAQFGDLRSYDKLARVDARNEGRGAIKEIAPIQPAWESSRTTRRRGKRSNRAQIPAQRL
jgi:hypothetical protein